MKILLVSHFFHPSVGGIEQVSYLLAHGFAALGHEVQVVTGTKEEDGRAFPFLVHRQPQPGKMLRLIGWCDVCFHNNISLQRAWPLLAVNRPWVIAHHTWIRRVSGKTGVRDHLKKRILSRATNIAVSKALSDHLGVPSTVITNPYDDSVFKADPAVERSRDLVYLGRLVSDKGIDLLIEALARLREKGFAPGLTIIGAGPEEEPLRQRVQQLSLGSQVEFAGRRSQEELPGLLSMHRILVAPSRWEEPFGLVALEGMACGCIPLGSDAGGLPEAIGEAGVVFRRGDAEDLACKIEQLADPNVDLEKYRRAAAAHLERHRAEAVVRRYLEVLETARA